MADGDEALMLIVAFLQGDDPGPQLARLDAEEARAAAAELAQMLAMAIAIFGGTPAAFRSALKTARLERALAGVATYAALGGE